MTSQKKEITHDTTMGEIFKMNEELTKQIIKQMQVYGLEGVGYGIDYSKTIAEHAEEQAIPKKHLQNMLKAINRKL